MVGSMRDYIEHGTPAGWQMERKDGSENCPACKAAWAGYMAGFRSHTETVKCPARHGTKAGVQEHAMTGVELCSLCAAWANAYMKAAAA